MSEYLFQYCQKIVIFNKDDSKILLARRVGERDYNATYTFIGGKMETIDESLAMAMKREKDEEIGAKCKLLLLPTYSHNLLFRKKDGSSMVIPHYYAQFQTGEISLSDEYDDYTWVNIAELDMFEPKINNIPMITSKILRLKVLAEKTDFITI